MSGFLFLMHTEVQQGQLWLLLEGSCFPPGESYRKQTWEVLHTQLFECDGEEENSTVKW